MTAFAPEDHATCPHFHEVRSECARWIPFYCTAGRISVPTLAERRHCAEDFTQCPRYLQATADESPHAPVAGRAPQTNTRETIVGRPWTAAAAPGAALLDTLRSIPLDAILERAAKSSAADCQRALGVEPLSLDGAAMLLRSPWSEAIFAEIVERARASTVRVFGRTVRLYAPLYVSSFCSNDCLYCDRTRPGAADRRLMKPERVVRVARHLVRTGIGRVVLVAAESPAIATDAYVAHLLSLLDPIVPELDVNVGSAEKDDYGLWREAGADGVVVLQETYDRPMYEYFHPSGPKSDYLFRLGALEHAAEAGIHRLGMGVFLGTEEPARDLLALIAHARHLADRFPECEIVVGVPRIRRDRGFPTWAVGDDELVRFVAVLRLALPRAGIVASAREPAGLRHRLLEAGATVMSPDRPLPTEAYVECQHDGGREEVRDHRAAEVLRSDLEHLGYDVR